MFIERIIFTCQKAWKHRQALKAIPDVKDILSIDWPALHASGIRVVVLDFDGVLAPDNHMSINGAVSAVLKTAKDIFGSPVFILSNNPTKERQAFFARHFPEFVFIMAKKKPYPDGLLGIISREQCNAAEVILIDDRLLTGGLAATLAETKCLLIKNPYRQLRGNACRELAFMLLRAIERLLLR